MAAWQVETGVATGRAFDANGLLGRLKAWIVLAPASGGPGWYIYDDQSALPTNPYIVVCDKNNPSANTPAKFVQFMNYNSIAATTFCYCFIRWNNSTHIGYGEWSRTALPTFDAADFIYDFRGGPEALSINTRPSSTWYSFVVDEWIGDPVLIESESINGVALNSNCTGTAGPQIDGIQFTTNYASAIDANRKTYISIVLISGVTYSVRVYKDSGRTNQIATSLNFIGFAGGAKLILDLSQSNSSGVVGTISLVGATAAGNADYDCGTITLQNSGQAALFTAGKNYFITDHSNVNVVCYFKVTSVSGSNLILSNGIYRKFASGAVCSPYLHRYYSMGFGSATYNSNNRLNIPYYSTFGRLSEIYSEYPGFNMEQITPTPYTIDWTGSNYTTCPGCAGGIMSVYVETLVPDIYGDYASQRIGISQMKGFFFTNQSKNISVALGQSKNILVTNRSLVQMSTGMPIDGINFLYLDTLYNIGGAITSSYGNSQSLYCLIRDGESVS